MAVVSHEFSENKNIKSIFVLNALFYGCCSSGRSTNCGEYFRKILKSESNLFKRLFNNFECLDLIFRRFRENNLTEINDSNYIRRT